MNNLKRAASILFFCLQISSQQQAVAFAPFPSNSGIVRNVDASYKQQVSSLALNKHRLSGPISPIRMSTETEAIANDTDTENTDNNSQDEEWWQSVKLEGDALAQKIRADFPILSEKIASEEGNAKDLIYFDSAATSHKPTYVTDALTSYYNTINSNVHRGAHTLSQKATAKYEAARDSIANFVNAYSRNEIIFTSGATEALNLIAATYGRANIEKGDEIIISELEHHSNIVPWQILCEEKGAVLKYIPLDPETGCMDLKVLPNLLSDKTKIVSFQHVSNVMASINPVEDIVSLTRSLGSSDVKIILDACQSVPHMPVDVQSLGVDFLAASGHKMCGPTGIGFLWGKEDILNSMPPYMGGGEMIDEVYMDHSTFAKAPARFEAGTPAIAQSIGLGAAIEYLNEVGMDNIYNYEKELAEYFSKRMSEVDGITVLGPKAGVKRAAIVSFVCDNVHPSDLSTFLDMEGVAVRAGHHCCQPLHRAMGYSHSARASLYFYNTKEEIDAFIIILKETLAFLGGGAMSDVDDEFVPFI